MDTMQQLTDTQRVTYVVEKLQNWQNNLRANAEFAQGAGATDAAGRALVRANDMRDILAMLDGSEDASIRLFLTSRGLI